MNPTPEQVAQWAREAGEYAMQHIKSPVVDPDEVFNMHLATRAFTEGCAHQAEQDAAHLEYRANVLLTPKRTNDVDRHTAYVLQSRAAYIRANAPKELK